jgi:hypothetical protein
MEPSTLFTIYGLEHLGFLPRGEAATFNRRTQRRPDGKLPLNTNEGGLSCSRMSRSLLNMRQSAGLLSTGWLVTFNRRDFGAVPARFGIDVLTPSEAIRRIRT